MGIIKFRDKSQLTTFAKQFASHYENGETICHPFSYLDRRGVRSTAQQWGFDGDIFMMRVELAEDFYKKEVYKSIAANCATQLNYLIPMIYRLRLEELESLDKFLTKYINSLNLRYEHETKKQSKE